MFCSCLVFQGTNASALEKDIGPEQFPINEHYFGLVNVSSAQFSHVDSESSPPPARRSAAAFGFLSLAFT